MTKGEGMAMHEGALCRWARSPSATNFRKLNYRPSCNDMRKGQKLWKFLFKMI